MMQLYHVTSIAKEYRGFKDVEISWFMLHRAQQPVVPYAELIADYAELNGDDRMSVECVVDEMFTEAEANALLAWLNKHRPAVHQFQATTIPLRGRDEDGSILMAMREIPLGGPQDCIVPNEADWDLPFKVNGYFDLRFSERVEPQQEWSVIEKFET
jgi:hypothetical protein